MAKYLDMMMTGSGFKSYNGVLLTQSTITVGSETHYTIASSLDGMNWRNIDIDRFTSADVLDEEGCRLWAVDFAVVGKKAYALATEIYADGVNTRLRLKILVNDDIKNKDWRVLQLSSEITCAYDSNNAFYNRQTYLVVDKNQIVINAKCDKSGDEDYYTTYTVGLNGGTVTSVVHNNEYNYAGRCFAFKDGYNYIISNRWLGSGSNWDNDCRLKKTRYNASTGQTETISTSPIVFNYESEDKEVLILSAILVGDEIYAVGSFRYHTGDKHVAIKWNGTGSSYDISLLKDTLLDDEPSLIGCFMFYDGSTYYLIDNENYLLFYSSDFSSWTKESLNNYSHIPLAFLNGKYIFCNVDSQSQHYCKFEYASDRETTPTPTDVYCDQSSYITTFN